VKDMNLALRNVFVHTSRGSPACSKMLRHEADGFTSPPKEGVLRICIALKNPLFRRGLNPRILGSVTVTVTVTVSGLHAVRMKISGVEVHSTIHVLP
jgi:hypothetical protein